jgi:YidC/Oxa1 family membrane protein insertase
LLTLSFFLIQYWFTDDTASIAKAKAEQEKIATSTEKQKIDNVPTITTPKIYEDEEFFVLENEYFQLVFSNIGGALAEINLPFQNKTNTKSVVKKIDIDRTMMDKYPNHDQFPAHPYFITDENNKKIRIDKTKLDGYYPLLRRSSYNNKQFYALNIVNNKEHADIIYKVKRFEKNLIEFEGEINGRTIIKTFSISSSLPYCIDVNISSEKGNKKLWLTSGVPEVELILDSSSPELKYRTLRKDKSSIEKISLPKSEIEASTTEADWVCNSNSFFGIILNGSINGYKAQCIEGKQLPPRLAFIDTEYNLYPPDKFPGYELLVPLKSNNKLTVFAGPFDDNILRQLDKTLTKDNYNPDFLGAKTTHGFMSAIASPFAKILFWCMKFFYFITHSWGISILLLTVLIRIALYPLNTWSIKSQNAMQKLTPKTKAIQDRYKNDPKKAQMEVMKLYKESGANPVAGGCLPLLVQIPLLFGMYLLLKSSFEIRGESFIPGWIDNLSAPDVIFSWNYPLLLIGNQLHLLPFLLGLATFIQQKYMTTMPKDKSQMTEQQKQMRLMANIMGIVLIFMFYNLPSGLNIFYLFTTILGIAQQWWVNKKLQVTQN